MFRDLQNRPVLITGSSRGIGLATARLLKRVGAKPLLNARAKSEALERAATELETEQARSSTLHWPPESTAWSS